MKLLPLILAFIAGYAIIKKKKDSNEKYYEHQFTGAFPRNSGAINAVSGGDPEDLNGMPVDILDTVNRP